MSLKFLYKAGADMKAVVFHGVGDIRLDDVADPKIEKSTDAIVRFTASAICGTDLHFIRGTMEGMKSGTILGHEGVGVIEELGSDVRNFKVGDRVVVASTIACGNCVYCRAGYYSQCDVANPNGPQAGTAFFGGPVASGPFQGLQAERARIPFANVGLVKIPNEISDDQAITLSDIFPTGYFGAVLAEIKVGDTVAVYGCGPVGLFAIASAKFFGAGRIFAIDTIPSRLEVARSLGAEIIDYNSESPVEAIQRLTQGIGVDRVIDAVGVDANHPHTGLGFKDEQVKEKQFQQELNYVAPNRNPQKDNWHPGDAPTQVLRWAIESIAKAGSLSIIGVYPPQLMVFPIGQAMNKNITIKMGNCNHRKYIPRLIELILSHSIDPSKLVTQHEAIESALDAYRSFDTRKAGWIKVKLEPDQNTRKVA